MRISNRNLQFWESAGVGKKSSLLKNPKTIIIQGRGGSILTFFLAVSFFNLHFDAKAN
jgi:hypothetical protein